MIYLYTQKQNEPSWIMRNDWYFNLYTGNQPLTKEEKEAVADIDGARVLDNMRIETEYGLGTIRNLSSGCKTYLNILKNPEKVVCAEECGGNVLERIFKLDTARIYMDRPERFWIDDGTEICFDDKEIVIGRAGYENWWSKEYERKAENDI